MVIDLLYITSKQNNMNNHKKFGVWMDNHQATIVAGNEDAENGTPVILTHIKGEEVSPSSSQKNEHNQEKSLRAKFFKEITTQLQNATHLHITGTGQVQEQFIHYLAETPQFKNTKTQESTSNKMSDEKLLAFFSDKLN
jgi:stalled ribosome rescue protein Dom34